MLTRAQIPNALTFFRVAAVPLALVLMVMPEFLERDGLLFWLFVLASLTDFLDGYLARKWNATSAIGAMLDPVADKLLVALMLLYLLLRYPPLLLPVAVIILRELYISGLREFLAARQIALPVSRGGKLKTAMQMLGIGLIFAAPLVAHIAPDMPGDNGPFPAEMSAGLGVSLLGGGCIWIAALLALWSAWGYTRAALRTMRVE